MAQLCLLFTQVNGFTKDTVYKLYKKEEVTAAGWKDFFRVDVTLPPTTGGVASGFFKWNVDKERFLLKDTQQVQLMDKYKTPVGSIALRIRLGRAYTTRFKTLKATKAQL